MTLTRSVSGLVVADSLATVNNDDWSFTGQTASAPRWSQGTDCHIAEAQMYNNLIVRNGVSITGDAVVSAFMETIYAEDPSYTRLAMRHNNITGPSGVHGILGGYQHASGTYGGNMFQLLRLEFTLTGSSTTGTPWTSGYRPLKLKRIGTATMLYESRVLRVSSNIPDSSSYGGRLGFGVGHPWTGSYLPHFKAKHFVVTTSDTLEVSSLPAGYYVRVADGTATIDLISTSGTATVDCSLLCPLSTGYTLDIYDGNPASGGKLIESKTGVYAGDTWVYSAPTSNKPFFFNRFVLGR